MLCPKDVKIQNIEELLNGIKDFTEGQKRDRRCQRILRIYGRWALATAFR
jgi:hypothetical protein